MNDEFKKAHKEWLARKFVENGCYPNLVESADWVYEWCQKHRPYAAVCDMFAEQITKENLELRDKLEALTKEAEELTEALEYFKDIEHEQYLEDGTAHNALARWRKFKGE